MLREMPVDLDALIGALIAGTAWLAVLILAVAIGAGTDGLGYAGSGANLAGATAYANGAVRAAEHWKAPIDERRVRVAANSRRHPDTGGASR